MIKTNTVKTVAILLILFLFIGCKTQSKNWIVLFDGKSVKGLRGYKMKNFPWDAWKIEKGTLKTLVHVKGVDIISQDQYKDFELELEWKVQAGGNSGIFYFANERGSHIWQSAPEMQVLDNIVHVDGRVDPVNDKEIVQFELQLKDLEIVNKRLEKLAKTLRSGNDDSKKEIIVLEKIKYNLENSTIKKNDFTDDDYSAFIKPLELIAFKPVLYVCNVSEKDLFVDNEYVKKVKDFAASENSEVIIISAKIESEINELGSFDEKKIFLEDIGMKEPGSIKLIRSTYKLLNLHTFFTAGKKEVRAWTAGIGKNAYDAAGQIHSDFQKGFICSEVISYNDYIDNGSEIKSKEAGKMRLEGKDYIVEDGDIMHFRFNI